MTGHRPFRPLTPRQRQVAELYAAGHTRREIGTALRISEHTVRQHLESVALQVREDGDRTALRPLLRELFAVG